MIYEVHITAASLDFCITGWKQTVFQNLTHASTVIGEDILLTKQFEIHEMSKNEAMSMILKEANHPRSFPSMIKRIKIETGPDTRPFQSLYFEAHCKLKEIPSSSLGKRSRNKCTNAKWVTLRSTDYQALKAEFNILEIFERDKIIEKEIESVIFDSAPELDYQWMELNGNA